MTTDLDPYPVYKDSGLPWLGEVPGHWERKSLYRAIVAFSGEYAYDGAKLSEASLNGFPSSRIADKALGRVMTAVLQDDTELFKQFSDNEGCRGWLTDTVFALTYEAGDAGGLTSR